MSDEAHRVARRVRSAVLKHYKVDRRILETLNDPEGWQESSKYDGGYFKYTIKSIPISKVIVPKVWNHGRFDKAKALIEKGTPLDPVRLTERGGKFEIADGIHRTNASIALGYSHIPGLIATWIETPDLVEHEEPEKPTLPKGTWVRLRKPFDGRDVGWVNEYLGPRERRGVVRHYYGVALMREGDTYPDHADFGDHELDPADPPAWAKK